MWREAKMDPITGVHEQTPTEGNIVTTGEHFLFGTQDGQSARQCMCRVGAQCWSPCVIMMLSQNRPHQQSGGLQQAFPPQWFFQGTIARRHYPILQGVRQVVRDHPNCQKSHELVDHMTNLIPSYCHFGVWENGVYASVIASPLPCVKNSHPRRCNPWYDTHCIK